LEGLRCFSKTETKTDAHQQIVAGLTRVADYQIADVKAENSMAGWEVFKATTDIQGKMVFGAKAARCRVKGIAVGATYKFVAELDKPWPDSCEKPRVVRASSNLNAKEAQGLLAFGIFILGEMIYFGFKG
jgi:hypothetical protein